LQEKLEQAGYPHWLRAFDGRHEWAPAGVMNEAFAWFRIQAMRGNRAARNDNFISMELKTSAAEAEKFSANGDALAAYRQYKQIGATYEELADIAAFRGKAEELSQTKPVREGLKRERNDFEEQERLSSQILGAVQSKENGEAPRSEVQSGVGPQIRDLRRRAESEKKTERAVVLKRALAGVFVGAIEAGIAALEKKDYRTAASFFSAAVEARPEAEWPLRQLAIAQAFDKDRKAALETLRRIKPSDPAEFQSWLRTEPAFQILREKHELPQ